MKNKKWKLKFYKNRKPSRVSFRTRVVFTKSVSPYKVISIRKFRLFNRKIIISKCLMLCALKMRDTLAKNSEGLGVNLNIKKVKALSGNIAMTLNALSQRRLSLLRFFGKGVKYRRKSLVQIINHRQRISRRQARRSFLKQQTKYLLGSSSYLVLHVKVLLNNVFCHLTDNHGNTVFPVKTGPSYGIKMSKINIKLNLERFLSAYANDLARDVVGKNNGVLQNFVLNIASPKKYRKRIIRSCKNFVIKKFFNAQLKSRSLKSKVLSIGLRSSATVNKFLLSVDKQKKTPMAFTNIVDSKPFNGCRQIVLLKKKRMKLFSYKVR